MHSQFVVSAVGQDGARTQRLQSKRILTAMSQSPCLFIIDHSCFSQRLSSYRSASLSPPSLPFGLLLAPLAAGRSLARRPRSLCPSIIMASSSSAELDALERELDAEEYSLLQAPSSSSGLSSARSSVRGESVVTPSAARAAFTRNSMGGNGDGPAASRLPMVFTCDLDLDKCCLGIVGESARFCLALKVDGRTDCGCDAHSKKKFKPLPDHVYPPGGSC